MKILYAPTNIASMQAITTDALNTIEGVEAKCIIFGRHKYNTPSKNTIEIPGREVNIFKQWYYKLTGFLILIKYMRQADVIHWTWGSMYPLQLDLHLARMSKKKRFVEWVGSDIRIPDVTMQESKWYKDVFDKGYEYARIENKKKSYAVQERFKRLGFIPILVPEMKLFLKPGLFPKVYTTHYRIDTSSYKPVYPSVDNKKPVIVHSPSARIAKGSDYILKTLNELKKDYDFEYIELHDKPHEEVLKAIEKADIFIDQVILGSYAMAAIEAMSFGKPVFAYIMPRVFEQGLPADCPVVNANPDTLKEKLIPYLSDPVLRHETGVKSRAYVVRVHDADKIARQFYEIYSTA